MLQFMTMDGRCRVLAITLALLTSPGIFGQEASDATSTTLLSSPASSTSSRQHLSDVTSTTLVVSSSQQHVGDGTSTNVVVSTSTDQPSVTTTSSWTASRAPHPCEQFRVMHCAHSCNRTDFAKCIMDCTAGCAALVSEQRSAPLAVEFALTDVGPGLPLSVLAANSTLVLLAWTWWAYNYITDPPKHRLLGAFRTPWPLYLAAFCYWVAMPATLLVAGFYSSCSTGPPAWAYGIYGVFLLLHLLITVFTPSDAVAPMFDCSDVFSAFPTLLMLTALEHADMGSDMLFPGNAAACNPYITHMWLESWQESRGGHVVVPLLAEMTPGGLMLTLYITGAYLPQLMFVLSMFAPIFFLVCLAAVSLWVVCSWYVGLPVMLVAFAAVQRSIGSLQWREVKADVLARGSDLGRWAGILTLGAGRSVTDRMKELLFVGLTRVVLENMIQLWCQSILFAMFFDIATAEAKTKALASMGLSLGISLAKVLPPGLLILQEACAEPSLQGTVGGGVLLFPIICGLLGAAWVLLKVLFTFYCSSHIWNITTGCVDLSHGAAARLSGAFAYNYTLV